MAVPARRLAIEVDGPTHFCRNAPAPLGATRLKQCLLAQQGWAVANINAAEWEALRGAAQKRAHLATAIQAAAGSGGGGEGSS